VKRAFFLHFAPERRIVAMACSGSKKSCGSKKTATKKTAKKAKK